MSESGPMVVLSTVGDRASAERLAHSLVDARLVACVNILPGVTSFFRWTPDDDSAATVQSEDEIMLVMKTSATAWPALERHLQAEHPYELPEIIGWPIDRGLPAFCRWIDDSTAPDGA